MTYGKVAAVLILAPIGLVGGRLRWLDRREGSWAPEPWRESVAPQPGYDDMVAAARIADEEPYLTACREHPSTLTGLAARDPRNDPHLAAMREAVAKNRETIERVHAVVAEPCWVPYEAHPERPNIGVRDGPALSRLARVLSMDSRLHQADGDWAGSVAPCLDCMAMGLNMERGRDVVTALHGNAVALTSTQPLWYAAPRLDCGPARAAARRVEGLADSAPTHGQLLSWWTPTLARGCVPTPPSYIAVRARLNWAARLLGTPPLSPAQLERAEFADAPGGLGQWATLIHMPGPRERYRQMTTWLTALSGAVDQPYDQYVRPATSGLEWAAKEGQTWARSRSKWPAMAANLRLLSANLALQAYHAEHGRYPDSLAELVPTNLSHLPPDPFTSGPLRYRRDGKSFLCWSIGPDGRDDQARRIARGESNSPATGVTVSADSVGDIVTP